MTIPKFISLVERGWSLDHIFILENLEDVAPLINFPRGASLLQTLLRKGMIDEKDSITQDGRNLLEFSVNENIEEPKKEAKIKAVDGIEGLHKKLEDRILALTGKKQVKAAILGKNYPFLCNAQDLMARIKKVMVKYKLNDFQAIEDCLLGYIETCYKRGKWYPLIAYYIIKQKEGIEGSQMVTDMRSYVKGEQKTAIKDFEI
jgi:hypothetical protein